jgi:peptidoglycan hydrolase-like protein with peptidoglycan-binding domain
VSSIPVRHARAGVAHSDLTSTPVVSAAPAGPEVHTINGLRQALKMLGYRIAVDGEYGSETRQAITSFQMHAGIVADGIAGEPDGSCLSS